MAEETTKNVFYGCNQCHQERAVASEEDIPLGHLCSDVCREAWLAERSVDDDTEGGA